VRLTRLASTTSIELFRAEIADPNNLTSNVSSGSGGVNVPGLSVTLPVLPYDVTLEAGGGALSNSNATLSSVVLIKRLSDSTNLALNFGTSATANAFVPTPPVRYVVPAGTAANTYVMALASLGGGTAKLNVTANSVAFLRVLGPGAPSGFSTYASGRTQTGEYDWSMLPPRYAKNGTSRGVIYCHGATQTATGLGSGPTLNEVALLRTIAQYFPVVASDVGGPLTWGNSAAMTAISAAKTYLESSLGARTDGVLLVGHSMGGGNAYDWYQQHPTLVKAMVGVSPVSDLQAFYAANRGSYQAGIGTALGVTYPTPVPASADPNQTYSNLIGKPIKVYYGSSDLTVLPSEVTSLATKIGATAVNVGAYGHGEATLGALPLPDLMAFLLANA
jgi:pimeloyl-ACP methyl ester carboxylesterase